TVNAISFYPLTAHLTLNLLWMALLVEARADEPALAFAANERDRDGTERVAPPGSPAMLTATPRRLLAAGVVGSLALVLHNPVPHAVFAVPWLPALLRRRGWRALAWLVLGYLPISLTLGLGWLPVRQSLTTTAAAVAGAPAQADSGVVAQVAALAARAFVLPSAEQLYTRVLALVELVTWAAPFLPLLALFGWLAARRGSPLRLLAISAVATLVLYVFVPFDQGHGWGYRYFHAAWAALPLLAAAALVQPRAARWRAPVLAAALLAIPLANGLRAEQVHSFIAEQRARLPPVPAAGRHLCFVSLAGGAYRVDLLQNDPFLRDRVVYLASAGFARDAELVARRFPGAALMLRRGDDSVWRLP
ncbi:MAG TPA: hypothetical protein VN923_02600, partial [Thermoanaerobaculia bacterium]|nr:hypothetical protein [Thermoanaerobaculia bacterium]